MASNCPSIWDESELDVASVGGTRKKSSAFDKGNDCVHNEVLCYLINKIDIISHDLLVKIEGVRIKTRLSPYQVKLRYLAKTIIFRMKVQWPKFHMF